MYPWYRDSVAAAAAAGLGGPVGVVGSGFCSTGPGQGGTTIKTETGYSDCMLALDYVQSKVSFTNVYLYIVFLLNVVSNDRERISFLAIDPLSVELIILLFDEGLCSAF